MSSYERIMAAVEFRTPDRLPVWDNYWESFVSNWQRYRGFQPTSSPTDYYSVDISMCTALEHLFPSQIGLVRDDGEYEIHRDGWGRTTGESK